MCVTAPREPLNLLCYAVLRHGVTAICNLLKFICNGRAGVSPPYPHMGCL